MSFPGAPERSAGYPLPQGRFGPGDLEVPACFAAAGWDGSWSCRKRLWLCGLWSLSAVVVGSAPLVEMVWGPPVFFKLQPQELCLAEKRW